MTHVDQFLSPESLDLWHQVEDFVSQFAESPVVKERKEAIENCVDFRKDTLFAKSSKPSIIDFIGKKGRTERHVESSTRSL